MDEHSTQKYAALLVRACLDLQPGDRLRIYGETCHRPFMLAVAKEAYAAGARNVRFDYTDPAYSRIRAEGCRDEWLDDVPSHAARDAEIYADEAWINLSLLGEADPSALEGVDAQKLQRMIQARSKVWKPYREATMANKVAWCVAPLPTEAWARSIFGAAGRDPGPDPEATLWEVLVPILGLDAQDPAAAAKAHGALLETRAQALNGFTLDSLRFTGPGTDLVVGLSPASRWIGGGSRTPSGRFFLPNHPTEEVFTSPDARRTSGRVTCTRPLQVLGAKVEGAWFEFEAGVVTRFGAAKNEASLGGYLDTDPGARRLGEVALVDAEGAIYRSGLVFDNGLIDENAACHIALGAAYPEAFEGAQDLDEAGKAAQGFNVSMVHEDFMIGSPEVTVRGLSSSGKEIPILSGGRFGF